MLCSAGNRHAGGLAYNPDALTKPVLDGREDWIELYYKAWDLAADNINFANPGSGFTAEYMDEALTDRKVWQWDTLFISMFAKYSNGELPIMTGVDNFYRKQRSDGYICRELSEVDGTDIYPNSAQPWPVSNPNPPLYSWAEWDYYRVTGDASRFTKAVTSNRKDERPHTKTVLERLFDHHFWIKNNIRHADGHYRSDYWANGMDDSPRNSITMDGGWMDLAAQQALSALYLAKIAAVVGDDAKREAMLAEHREHKDLVNNAYWHEADKFYYDLDAERKVYKSRTVAAFYGDRIRLKYGGSVRFRDQSIHGPNRWDWRFPGGDPTSSAERSPVVRYPAPGEYDVTLKVGNAYGESVKSYQAYVDVLGDLPKDYCYTAPSYTRYSYISRTALGPLDNRTGSDGYSLHRAPVPIAVASTQTLLVEIDVINPVNNDRTLVRAWVDWNADRQFDDSERIMDQAVFISAEPVQASQSFAVPNGVHGIRRMRVKANYDTGPARDFGACLGFNSGEAEDYQIEIVHPPPSPRQKLRTGGDQLALDLRSMFLSDSERPVSYSAESDNAALATAQVAAGRLLLRSNSNGGRGVANIVVTATYGDGRQATFSLVVTVSAATRSHLWGWRLAVIKNAQSGSQ